MFVDPVDRPPAEDAQLLPVFPEVFKNREVEKLLVLIVNVEDLELLGLPHRLQDLRPVITAAIAEEVIEPGSLPVDLLIQWLGGWAS